MNSHCRSGALFATPLIRRTLLSSAAVLTGLGALRFRFVQAAVAESLVLETHLGEVLLASGTSLSIQRRGQVVLFGTQQAANSEPHRSCNLSGAREGLL